jgi:hypothetical protein
MSRAVAALGRAADDADEGSHDAGYLERSSRPLAALVFLLPFVLLYEFGTRWLLTDPVQGTQQVVAFTLLDRFFGVFGAAGKHFPAFALVSILLAWHFAQKDGWRIKPTTLLGMFCESIALGIPLIIGGLILARMFRTLPLGAANVGHITDTTVLAFGAGIYEELVFRLIGCTLLAIVFRSLLKVPNRLSTLLVVVVSATLFSAYHYLGNEAFNWQIFVFRATAGVYFAILFLLRGFGVTAGAHMAYDILIVML